MKVLNFFLRMVYGAVGIQTLNILFAAMGVSVSVGLNFVGFSGLGLLFGIAAFAIL